MKMVKLVLELTRRTSLELYPYDFRLVDGREAKQSKSIEEHAIQNSIECDLSARSWFSSLSIL